MKHKNIERVKEKKVKQTLLKHFIESDLFNDKEVGDIALILFYEKVNKNE